MMKTIGIIGAGTMGSGIAQILALKGYQVLLNDVTEDFVEKGISRVEKNLDRSVAKERLSAEERDQAMARIQSTLGLEDMANADLVIEAAAEKMEIKDDIFKALEKICREDTILATNTSSLSINSLAQKLNRPERFVGMHFFNPVPVMKLVEVVKGEKTASEVIKTIRDLAQELGKSPVEVVDSPGFIVNRLLVPMINEAAILYGEGVATAEAIDKGMELGANHPIGPLALADLVGLDVCLAIMESLHESLGEEKYRPAPSLREKVEEGQLGRKTKQGFYSYE